MDSGLCVFVDSDWAGDQVDRKSILGFVVIFKGGAVSWRSKKQTSVVLLTVEAEFIAASMAVKKILWHQRFFQSLGMYGSQGTPLLIDNQGVLDLIKSGQINDRTKHIDIRFRHICNHEKTDDIVGEHVATEDQMADIMTKSLGMMKFGGLRKRIGVKE